MILVTGGAGYIGSILTRALCETGADVLVIDDLSTGVRSSVDPRAEFIVGDINDSKFLEVTLQNRPIESVYHLAAKIQVEESVRLPELYFRVNTEGTRTLAEVVRKLFPNLESFLLSSTASVYGDPVTQNGKSKALVENQKCSPANPYGASKLKAEGVLREIFKDTSTQVILLRYFNVAGASEDLKFGQSGPYSTHLIRNAAKAALGLIPNLKVFGTDYPTMDGTCERDYIHVEDLVDLHIRITTAIRANKSAENIHTVNCGYGKSSSVLAVIQAMEDACGHRLKVEHAPRRAGDSAQVWADTTTLKNILDWSPKFNDLVTMCRSAYLWEKKIS